MCIVLMEFRVAGILTTLTVFYITIVMYNTLNPNIIVLENNSAYEKY